MKHYNLRNIFYITIVLLFVYACNTEKKNHEVLASVYDYELLSSDIEDVIPNNLSKEDSLLFVVNYINRWVKEQAILYKAESSVQTLDKEFGLINKRVEEYRNSLLIYNFEKRFVSQNLDTIVKYEEVEAFYNANKKEFALKDDIVQIAYVKMFSDAKNKSQVRSLLKKYKVEDLGKIKSIAEQEAVNYLLNEDTWIVFDELAKEIPIQTYNKSLYLKNNKYIEVNDSLYTYMLRVNKYKIRNNLSPLSFEYDRIEKIIINMRKMQMIDKLHNDIFIQAQEDGKIIILK